MECPICFDSFNDATKMPIKTFCRCHQTLCKECLEKLLNNFTYCPWDRTRWSGRNLLSKFVSSTPENYLETLAAQAKAATSAAATASRHLCPSSSSPISLLSTPTASPAPALEVSSMASSAVTYTSAASSSSTSSSSSSYASSSNASFSALSLPIDLASLDVDTDVHDLRGLDWDIEEQERLYMKIENQKRARGHAPPLSGSQDAPRKRSKMDLLRYFILDLSSDSSTSAKPRRSPDSQKRPTKRTTIAHSTIAHCLQSSESSVRTAALQCEPSTPCSSSWSCGHCSFANFPLLVFCEMCEAPRQPSTVESRSSAEATVL